MPGPPSACAYGLPLKLPDWWPWPGLLLSLVFGLWGFAGPKTRTTLVADCAPSPSFVGQAMAFVSVVKAVRELHCTGRHFKMWTSRAQVLHAFSLAWLARTCIWHAYLRETAGDYKGARRCWNCEKQLCPQRSGGPLPSKILRRESARDVLRYFVMLVESEGFAMCHPMPDRTGLSSLLGVSVIFACVTGQIGNQRQHPHRGGPKSIPQLGCWHLQWFGAHSKIKVLLKAQVHSSGWLLALAVA